MTKPMDRKPLNLVDHFLIAMPQLQGSYFGNTLVYMWRHGEEGALGTVVNLPLRLKLADIFSQLDIEVGREESAERTVLSGGPVETDKGFILHDAHKEWTSTIEITKDIRVTTSKDILADIGRGKGPRNFLVALGFAGWSPGQLEQEIADNSWIACPATKEIIFSTDYANKPDLASATLGFSMAQLTTDVGHS